MDGGMATFLHSYAGVESGVMEAPLKNLTGHPRWLPSDSEDCSEFKDNNSSDYE